MPLSLTDSWWSPHLSRPEWLRSGRDFSTFFCSTAIIAAPSAILNEVKLSSHPAQFRMQEYRNVVELCPICRTASTSTKNDSKKGNGKSVLQKLANAFKVLKGFVLQTGGRQFFPFKKCSKVFLILPEWINCYCLVEKNASIMAMKYFTTHICSPNKQV